MQASVVHAGVVQASAVQASVVHASVVQGCGAGQIWHASVVQCGAVWCRHMCCMVRCREMSMSTSVECR